MTKPAKRFHQLAEEFWKSSCGSEHKKEPAHAYHPKWDEFLAEGHDSYFVLCCMDRNEVRRSILVAESRDGNSSCELNRLGCNKFLSELVVWMLMRW